MALSHPEVWFVLPSANAANCRRNLPKWRDQGYRVALLQDRERFDADCDAIVVRDKYPGWGASVNQLFREVVPETCPVIVAGGDDMLPDPDVRAAEIAEQFLDHFGGNFGVMQPTGDDYERTRAICGSPWIGRSWMRRMYAGTGGMPECYVHQWADDELYWVSRCAGRFWERPDLTQYHEHFLRTGQPTPGYWAESAAANNERDCLTFIARSRSGFPGAAPKDDPGVLDIDVFRAAYDGRAESVFRGLVGGDEHRSANDRLRSALRDCAADGQRRVAIFGAGLHTHRAGEALRQPPVEILCVIDEDPARIGSRLWNYPVVSPEHAAGMDVDAVVLSSDRFENQLRERSAVFAARGIQVVSLYETRPAMKAGA